MRPLCEHKKRVGRKEVGSEHKVVGSDLKVVANGRKVVASGRKVVASGRKMVANGRKVVASSRKVVAIGSKPPCNHFGHKGAAATSLKNLATKMVTRRSATIALVVGMVTHDCGILVQHGRKMIASERKL